MLKIVTLVLVCFLVSCSTTSNPSGETITTGSILLIPDDNNVIYDVGSYCSFCPEIIDELDDVSGTANVKFAINRNAEIRVLNFDYYSIWINPQPTTRSIKFPFIKEHTFTAGSFVKNSDGTITFPNANLITHFSGTVNISGTCEAYGDDYQFGQDFGVKKGSNNLSIRSTTGNQYNNTVAQCGWSIKPTSVSGADSSLTFR